MLSTTGKARTAFAAVTIALLSSADIVTAQNGVERNGFREIATDFGDSKPTGVVLPSICIGDFIVPKTMYTIEPAEEGETEVKILTNPQDLVEPGYDDNDGLIYFKFIQEISQDAEDAGIIIQFPADQLLSVNSCCSQSVQIKKGFTNFQSLTASTSAVVNATFAVEQDNDMVIGVFTNAEVNVAVTETIGSKNTRVEVTATDNAKANIDGDITTLSCNDESDCMIAGVIEEPAESRSRGRSTVQTTSCEDILVADDSICQSKTPNVTVDTEGDLTISGVKEECVGGEDLDGLGGPVDPSDTNSGVPTVSSQPTAAPILTQKPTSKKTRRPTGAPTARPTVAPTPLSTSAAFNGATQGALTSIVGAAIGGAVSLLLLGQ